MTLPAARTATRLDTATVTPPRDLVWRSSSLIDLYLARLRDALPMHHPQIEIMQHIFATMPTPVRSFLDLGSGDGILASALLQRYPLAHGVLADASDRMLQIARTKLQPYEAQLAFLPFDLGSAWSSTVAPYGPFDVIVSGYAIHHLPDREKQQVYQTIHALLTPGGRFINIEYVASPTAAGEDMFMSYLTEQAYAAEQQHGGPMSQAQTHEVVEALMHTPDDRPSRVETQCAWLREFGFTDVDCYFKVFGFAMFGGRRAGGVSIA
jgi:ubiquinone/menaquinone biosynthesis C-methylase UbiE